MAIDYDSSDIQVKQSHPFLAAVLLLEYHFWLTETVRAELGTGGFADQSRAA